MFVYKCTYVVVIVKVTLFSRAYQKKIQIKRILEKKNTIKKTVTSVSQRAFGFPNALDMLQANFDDG